MKDLERFIFDNLNLIILLAFILLPLLLGRRNGKKRAPRSPMGPSPREEPPRPQRRAPPKNLEETIRKFFEELSDEQRAPRPVARTSPRPKPPAAAPAEATWPEAAETGPVAPAEAIPPPPSESPPRVETVPAAPPRKAEQRRKAAPRKRRKTRKKAPSTAPKVRGAPVPGPGVAFRRLSARDMRKAVVWKEILDPPVSLREEGYGR